MIVEHSLDVWLVRICHIAFELCLMEKRKKKEEEQQQQN